MEMESETQLEMESVEVSVKAWVEALDMASGKVSEQPCRLRSLAVELRSHQVWSAQCDDRRNCNQFRHAQLHSLAGHRANYPDRGIYGDPSVGHTFDRCSGHG